MCEFMDGWRKRKRADVVESERGSLISFSIENPKSSKLFKMECLDFLGARKLVTTSYCSYGFEYRKNTSVLTSILSMKLRPVCTHETHRGEVQGCPQSQKNSLPAGLTRDIVKAWVRSHAHDTSIQSFLFVDAFSGWGSVSAAVAPLATEWGRDIRCYDNDMCSQRHHHSPNNTITLESQNSFDVLMAFALQRCFPERVAVQAVQGVPLWISELKQRRIAVLLHASFPCTTYSTAAGNSHRRAGCLAPHSKLGNTHDRLLEEMCKWLCVRRHQSGDSGTTNCTSCESDRSTSVSLLEEGVSSTQILRRFEPSASSARSSSCSRCS